MVVIKKKSLVDRLDTLSYSAIFIIWGCNLFFFACIYVFLSYSEGNGPVEITSYATLSEKFLSSFYYSVITATNTGYGDILPIGISRFFAALEAFLGLFLFALFMSKLVSRRQDVALRQMHKISFENSFHTIREDLHIIREDFGRIMHEATPGQPLTTKQGEILSVAYELESNLFRDVPKFYSDEEDLYIIDPYRERLLLEAFHRTLVRNKELLAHCDALGIPWRNEGESVAHMREMLADIAVTMPLWRSLSEHGESILFEQILVLGAQMGQSALKD
jgi:hypothetical protein